MKGITINQAALTEVLNDPNGPIAIELVLQGSVFAVDAKESLSIPRPRGQGRHYGNPFMRTGDLRNSIVVESPKVENGQLVCYVASDESRSGGHYQPNYARLLLDGSENNYGPYGPFKFLSAGADAKLTY